MRPVCTTRYSKDRQSGSFAGVHELWLSDQGQPKCHTWLSGCDRQHRGNGAVSDKVLIQGLGSVMVRDWPTMFCSFLCSESLSTTPVDSCCCSLADMGMFLQHLGCCFGTDYLGESEGTA